MGNILANWEELKAYFMYAELDTSKLATRYKARCPQICLFSNLFHSLPNIQRWQAASVKGKMSQTLSCWIFVILTII